MRFNIKMFKSSVECILKNYKIIKLKLMIRSPKKKEKKIEENN